MFRKVSLEVAYPQATEFLACLFQGSKIFAVSPAMSQREYSQQSEQLCTKRESWPAFPIMNMSAVKVIKVH